MMLPRRSSPRNSARKSLRDDVLGVSPRQQGASRTRVGQLPPPLLPPHLAAQRPRRHARGRRGGVAPGPQHLRDQAQRHPCEERHANRGEQGGTGRGEHRACAADEELLLGPAAPLPLPSHRELELSKDVRRGACACARSFASLVRQPLHVLGVFLLLVFRLPSLPLVLRGSLVRNFTPLLLLHAANKACGLRSLQASDTQPHVPIAPMQRPVVEQDAMVDLPREDRPDLLPGASVGVLHLDPRHAATLPMDLALGDQHRLHTWIRRVRPRARDLALAALRGAQVRQQ
mmetsp:Transcript_75326/g.191097  ORF Transcript_75326/g.191097 Transcript_75326/m.191097 type:complete len:288 (+) Transcript_75326:3-866(+)